MEEEYDRLRAKLVRWPMTQPMRWALEQALDTHLRAEKPVPDYELCFEESPLLHEIWLWETDGTKTLVTATG